MTSLRLTPLLTLLFACGKDDGPADDSAPGGDDTSGGEDLLKSMPRAGLPSFNAAWQRCSTATRSPRRW